MTRKIFIYFAVTVALSSLGSCATNASSKENYNDILSTKDTKKIESFLKSSHPEDSRRSVLKQKLIALKNEEWTKGKLAYKPMAPRPIVTEVPNEVFVDKKSNESEEFQKLMLENSTAHKEKTLKLLNQLFDSDPTNKEAIILVQNNSDCNMIIRIQGKDYYNLAVPAKGENTVVIKKGDYTFSSNICGAKYNSSKKVQKSIMVILNNPVAKPQNAQNKTQNKAQK